ncbi:MAG: hypothetical protein AAFV93_15495 [Chloroflexota bacterium]
MTRTILTILMTCLIGISIQAQTVDGIPIPNTSLKMTEIEPIPDTFSSTIRETFTRYTQIIPPNNLPITIYAQDRISNAQIVQARNTLIFFLTDVPNAIYGSDKTSVANQMGENEATLILLNGSDGDSEYPDVNGQALFETELVVPGSLAYINNDYENHRDATFEEILHLVHDTGIGVDGRNTMQGVLPEFQAEIRAATNHAMENQIWPTTDEERGWINELSRENSLTQEYLASVVDSYYGLWGAFEEVDAGMWGIYIAQTREDIETLDPMGYALMGQFFSPHLTYNAELDPGFDGTFTMTFDANIAYTHKSQYLLHATLTGNNNANLTGNNQNNQLAGNDGDNVFDGMDGHDTVVFPREESAYTVAHNDDGTITVTGDGTDTLVNIEQILFATGSLQIEQQGNHPQTDETNLPTSLDELITVMMNHLEINSEDDFEDYINNLSEEEILVAVKSALGLGTLDEAEDLLNSLLGEEDGAEDDEEPQFGTIVSDTEIVSNGTLTIELQFMDQVNLPTGVQEDWSDTYKQLYVDAANQWLSALIGIEGRDNHTIIIQITVNELRGGNGAAGPDSDEQIGQYTFPTSGSLIIGSHTYEEGFDQIEFYANILHEIGHIIGIGSYTEAYTTYDEETDGNIFRGPDSNRGVEFYNALYGADVDFVPMSDDTGHLYDYVLQEDSQRFLPDGSLLPPLTHEFMANGVVFGSVTLGVLDDIGYIVDYSAAEVYTP